MIAFLDIETSGWSKEKNALCEIGLIITDGTEIITEYSTCIKPYLRPDGELVSYKDDAMVIHGITMQEIENGLTIEAALHTVKTLLFAHGVNTVAGHGIKSFDLSWLNYLMMRFSDFDFMGYNVIDTLSIARERNNGSCKLEDLCTEYGIPSGNHRALADAKASFELYKIMTNT